MNWQWWGAGLTGMDAMASFMRAMHGGMLLLVLPAFLLCGGITAMAYRRRNRFTEE